MKRALTGIAAAAVVLGAVSPMAFAATTTSGLTKANQLPIVVNGSAISTPYEMTGKDSGQTTGFFPIYYFNQALAKIGFTATWDGTTHTWAITAPGVTAAPVAGGVGTGNTTVTVNGTTVKMFNTQVAKDPAGGPKAQATTYLPIYYINNVLSALGVKGNFTGQTGLSISGGAVQGVSSLSAITVSGATVGTGSASSPAVLTGNNGGSLTFSTTLTDANGNPIVGTNVQFDVYASGESQPTATVNGSNVTASSITTPESGWSYQVATDASGQASLSLSIPSGSNASYEVQAFAPYTSNGTQVQTAKVYSEFVPQGQLGISPQGNPYDAYVSTSANAAAGVVPVTVTAAPNNNGVVPANEAITFTINGADAFFSDASGAEVDNGSDTQVAYTNAQGQATVYVNSTTGGLATVSASDGNGNNPSTSIQWNQSGIAAKYANVSASNATLQNGQTNAFNANVGQNVTITGQAQDASGNPVANAQVLVTAEQINSFANPAVASGSPDGDVAYVTGTGSSATTTDFPKGVNTAPTGVVANSAYGEVVTADANGNFSFTVTNTEQGDYNQFNLYAVSNGNVAQQLTNDNPIQVYWQAPSSISGISVDMQNRNNYDVWENGALQTSYNAGTFAGASTGTFEVGGFGGYAPFTSQNVTYTISANNKAGINQIDGVNLVGESYTLDGQTVQLPNKPATVTVTVDKSTGDVWLNNSIDLSTVPSNGTNGTYTPDTQTVTENGQSVVASNNFTVGVTDKTPEADTVTITSGTYKATASLTFGAAGVNNATNFSNVSMLPGQFQTAKFEVEDANGNPVADTATKVEFNPSALTGLYVTGVNGVQLQESVYNKADTSTSTQATPIALDGGASLGNGASIGDLPSVNIPGVASWTPGQNYFTVYTDSNGDVSLTLQAGGTSYYDTTAGTVYTANAASSGQSTVVNTYNPNVTNAGPDWSAIYIGGTNSNWGANNYQAGNIQW